MLAIAFLFFFLLYLAFSIGLARWAARQATERDYSGKKWGVAVFILMLGLIFWDWLPMEITYRYQCANNAGFFQDKTLDEWKAENPGVWETLDPEKFPDEYFVKVEHGWKKDKDMYYRLPDGTELIAKYDSGGKYMMTNMIMGDGVYRKWLNQSIFYEMIKTRILFHIYKEESKIIDYKTKKVIARYIDYATDIPPIGLIDDKLSDYKFWMQKASCESSGDQRNYKIFNDLKNKLTNGGR
ncbi:MAG: hypothetical protein KZQ91_11325 [Candidatus Thiodiazotropha sp. (ex Lucinoma borealis)]|nr:hypothetical protein [Candidatus Thiodiazotropha sp. (ex Lucinoma borealis)]